MTDSAKKVQATADARAALRSKGDDDAEEEVWVPRGRAAEEEE